jgi:predicted nucleic acid-binding protein
LSFLLDTNVVSELTRPRPNPKIVRWFAGVAAADLHLSVVTLGEIRKGIELKRAASPASAVGFEQWLGRLVAQYGARILPLDRDAADIWGRIAARERTLPVEDAQIASIALRHGLTVVTGNVRHVARTGAPYLDPF